MQDGLTGLSNRRHFLEVLAKRLDAHESAAVLFIDLDGFKPVNDTYGHDFGDTILVAIADRLANALDQDALVGRLGGDEFAVLLGAHGGDTTIAARAGTIVEAISAPITVRGITVGVGASIGISLSPRDASDVSGMLRAADIAMYHAKRTARGSFQFFAPWMRVGSAEVTQRQRALQARHGAGDQTNRMSYIT
jgi:diguanylate cyclase (GGDEF)-like protein